MIEPRNHCVRTEPCRSGGAVTTTLLVIGICVACDAHTSPQSHASLPAPTQPAAVENEPLDLTVRVRAERNGKKWGVAAGDTLKTGDFFELFVHLNQPAYLYVMELLPDSTVVTLFPDKGDLLLPAGREHRVPSTADESFQLDPHDKEENIYLLMSRAPLVRPGMLLTKLVDPPQHQQPAALRRPGPRRRDRVISITTRRVFRVKRPDGTPTASDAVKSGEDSTLVVRMSFKHT